MTRVLVTDGEQRSSLAVVRSLGAAGHEVAVTSSGGRPIAGASRYCSRTYMVPPPQSDASGYAAGVTEAALDFGASVLIPMTDTSAPLLLESRAGMSGISVPFPSLEEYLGISDKADLMEVAGGLGVPVPEQRVVTDPSHLADLADRGGFDYPVVLKAARSSVETSTGWLRSGVVIASSREELKEEGRKAFPPEAYPLLMQRRILGPGLGVFLLAWDGEIVASFAHRRLREKPPTGGVSVCRESIVVRPDLLEHSRRLLEHFRWRGVAMVEFKEDQATGHAYLMEINARFWGSLQLAIDSGVDFPTMLIDCVEGKVPEPLPAYRVGNRSRWLWGDVDHLLAVLRMPAAARRATPGIPGRAGALMRFLIPWRPGERLEVLRWRDPGPFLAESVNWFGGLRRK